MRILFFIILFFIGIRTKHCNTNLDCEWYQYCSKTKNRCFIQKQGFCYSNRECPNLMTCKKNTCVISNKTIQKSHELLHDHSISISAKALSDYLKNHKGHTTKRIHKCENEAEEILHLNQLHHYGKSKKFLKTLEKKPWALCALSDVCGNPKLRDKYKNFFEVTVYVDWLIIKESDGWWKKSHSLITKATHHLNQIYKPAGFRFESTVKIYSRFKLAKALGVKPKQLDYGNLKVHKRNSGCKYVRFKNRKSYCIGAEKLVRTMRGKNWRHNGAFQMLLVDSFTRTMLNGFGKFPWTRNHGMLVFRKDTIGLGTIPHEFGHGFGLLHTFRGYNRFSCGICQEYINSDYSGDMCSDTKPTPKNWNCKKQPNIKKYKNFCVSNKKGWNAEMNNIMNYGECRNNITPQQINRMRCFLMNEFKHHYVKVHYDKPITYNFKK